MCFITTGEEGSVSISLKLMEDTGSIQVLTLTFEGAVQYSVIDRCAFMGCHFMNKAHPLTLMYPLFFFFFSSLESNPRGK